MVWQAYLIETGLVICIYLCQINTELKGWSLILFRRERFNDLYFVILHVITGGAYIFPYKPGHMSGVVDPYTPLSGYYRTTLW